MGSRVEIEALFDEARRLSRTERDSLYSRRGVTDAVRREVESLIAFDDPSDGILDCPPHLRLRPAETSATTAEPAPTQPGSASHPQRIGPYRIQRQLGEGGFGIVYLAEQDAPVRRQVALKLLRRGTDSRQVVARFEAERQALALLDHPCIARMYDAGATDSGEPYVAMEYVEGAPLTRFADEALLDVRARLALFLQVCDAVQHAHQRGIVHRDLKPSNVLVTRRTDATSHRDSTSLGLSALGLVKVIDFGVAKAIGPVLTDKTLHTLDGHLVGTPAYMSPEQAAGRPELVDTRADVYALGVLLYELLTGTTPLELASLRELPLMDVLESVRTQTAMRPSECVRRGEAFAREAALRRRTTAAGLCRAIRGDLDWMVLKALEKDRERRYAGASELAGDVRNHLLGLPVTARRPSWTYVLGKFALRHRIAVAAAAAVLLSLTFGLAAALSSEAHAREQARAALLAQQSAEAAGRRADVLRGEAERALLALSGLIRNMLLDGRLGEHLDLARESIKLHRNVFGETDVETLSAMNSLAGACHSRGDFDTAIKLMSFVVEVLADGGPPDDPQLLLAKASLAESYRKSRRLEQAGPLWQDVVPHLVRAFPDAVAQRSQVLGDYARFLASAGRADEASLVLSSAIDGLRAAGEERGLDSLLYDLGMLLSNRGDTEPAIAALREAADVADRLRGRDSFFWLQARAGLAATLSNAGRAADAEPIFAEALADGGGDRLAPDFRASSEFQYGMCLARLGRFEDAEPKLLSAYDWVHEHLPGASRPVAAGLVELYTRWQKPEKATEWQQRATEN